LISIYAGLAGINIPAIEARFKNKNTREFKEDLAELLLK
jgi:hypothetical protein